MSLLRSTPPHPECNSFAKSRSPTRGEHVHQPLVSCLVTSPTTSPRRHVRRPSLPLPIRPDAVTVPLRDCCRECYPITEECLKEGTVWEEKFTRAARRRRNSSAADHAHAHTQRHRRVCDDVPGFAAIVSVDEVEKRHSITSAPDALTSEDEPDAGLLPSFSRRLKLADTPAVPIAEEAEDELFPLPSPSASSSHLPASAHGDDLSPLPQGARDSSPSPVPSPRPRLAQPDDQEDQRSRSSAYFTPDASPALPSLEEPRSQSSGSSDSSGPASPETPFTPPPRSVSIPAAVRQPSYYSETSSFEFVQTPPSEAMHGSPEMLSTSPSGKKRQFIHMPNLPTPGSFFRAGAEMFKGVSVMGSGSPMALSV